MKTILDPDFQYTPSHATDVGKRLRKDEIEWNLSLLNEIAEYLDNHSDVVDGADGPRPNRAMTLLQDLEALIAKLKENS
jgi:hypothetical protein